MHQFAIVEERAESVYSSSKDIEAVSTEIFQSVAQISDNSAAIKSGIEAIASLSGKNDDNAEVLLKEVMKFKVENG